MSDIEERIAKLEMELQNLREEHEALVEGVRYLCNEIMLRNEIAENQTVCGAKMDLKDHYCDRNKCLQMEYNGKGCAECESEDDKLIMYGVDSYRYPQWVAEMQKKKENLFIRVSDIKYVCDPYKDHDVKQYTAEEIAKEWNEANNK